MAELRQSEKNAFFRNRDVEHFDGPPRELVGYGEHPPIVRWANQAKVAINVVVNEEEGSEKTYAMGDGINDGMYELPFEQNISRDLAKESMYEYGSRAGIWRLFRVFDQAGIPATIFGAAVALERNPAVGRKIASRGDDCVGHGYRWSNHYEMSRDEERQAIRLAIESIRQTVGERPLGWYCREMSVNTRSLLVEEGGFEYDSDNYSDDLPYWTKVDGKDHLVVPYTLVTNDCRYIMGTGFGSPDDFFAYGKAALDRLRQDGDDCGRMMTIGVHPRISGHPARADGLARLIEYAQRFDDVVFMRRLDIARAFAEQVKPGQY